ncbi:MAG: ABC transporter ATP-binding protein [Clostridia bacterium]|nr:ABC transporter ATP-binding protein [Clostridia bacterium]
MALDSVNISINEGETVGLIGPNGSGKTTLINVITGVYRATAGRLLFRGQVITGLQPYEIRAKGIARTFQSNRMCWRLNVMDNILLGLHSKQTTSWWKVITNRRAWQKELTLGIEKVTTLLADLSPSLLSKLHAPMSSVPLIDRRRAEIARALISEPILLLLDEPTAGLNPVETMQIVDDVAKFKSMYPQMSIIIIEHDMGVISRISDRVVVLNAGKVIADGSYNEVVENPEVQKAYLGDEEI